MERRSITPDPQRPPPRRWLRGGVLLAVTAVAVVVQSRRSRDGASLPPAQTPGRAMISDERGSPARGESDLEIELAAHAEAQRVEEPETSDGEERRRELIAGDWEDDYQGRRQLTLRPDGTATMIVEPSGPGRRIFAARLQFEIEWTLHEGRLTMTTTDGEPKSKTQLIRRIFGDRAAYEVLALDGEQMLLRDVGDEAEYDWRRVRAAD